MSQFTRFSRGKIWFVDIGPCKRFDIFQLWCACVCVCAGRLGGELGGRQGHQGDEEGGLEKCSLKI